MPELIAKPALDHAPLTHGACRMEPVELGLITSIALYPGQGDAVAKVLAPLGLAFPAPNSLSQQGDARLVWTGRDQAFLIGATAPDFGGTAATTDQTGGWAALRVSGDAAAEVLMRHIPLDLRSHAFAPGRAVRAPLGHMSAVIIRDEAGFLILIFRSMVRTAWHEIETAMRSVAARA